jgi:hypothetical protein
MNCVELQRSLAEAEEFGNREQRIHLRTCPECSALVNELNLIAAAAEQLQAADEPSPRVWNSIELALRQEGLIRPQTIHPQTIRPQVVGALSIPSQSMHPRRPLVPSFSARWGAARWLVPAAAMLLLALGIYVRRESGAIPLVRQATVTAPVGNPSDLNDDDLMQEVAANAPTMKTQYLENLRQVNESIHDAQGMVDESPNDEEARRSLMDAYQQKSMLFEMAMDRSLP